MVYKTPVNSVVTLHSVFLFLLVLQSVWGGRNSPGAGIPQKVIEGPKSCSELD
jgi:hypothetical protein